MIGPFDFTTETTCTDLTGLTIGMTDTTTS